MRQERLDTVMANPELAPMLARTPTVVERCSSTCATKPLPPDDCQILQPGWEVALIWSFT